MRVATTVVKSRFVNSQNEGSVVRFTEPFFSRGQSRREDYRLCDAEARYLHGVSGPIAGKRRGVRIYRMDRQQAFMIEVVRRQFGRQNVRPRRSSSEQGFSRRF